MLKYKLYQDKELLNDWSKLINLSEEKVVKIQEEWDNILKENNEIYRQNLEEYKNKLNKINTFLKSEGLATSGKYYKKYIEEQIKSPNSPSYYPYAHSGEKIVNGIKLYNGTSPIKLVDLYKKIKYDYEQQIKRNELSDKINRALVAEAIKGKIDISQIGRAHV